MMSLWVEQFLEAGGGGDCFVQNRKTCSSILGNFLISLIISSFLFSPLFHFGTALFEMFSLTDRFSNILIFSLLFVNSLCCTPYYGRFPQVLPSNFIFIVLFSFMKAIFFYCSENGLFLFFLFQFHSATCILSLFFKSCFSDCFDPFHQSLLLRFLRPLTVFRICIQQ